MPSPSPSPSTFFRLRLLAIAGVSCLVITASAFAQKANPFSKFGGSWVGNGLIYLSNGSKERIRCRGGFTPSDLASVSALKLELRCAGDSYNFELQSDLNYGGSGVTGTWTEITRGLNGRVTGTVTEDKINAVAEGQTFTAMLEVISLGDKQQVRITSPGSELSDVLIGLVRTAQR